VSVQEPEHNTKLCGPACRKPVAVQMKMAGLPSDINLRIADHARRFITDHKKKVDVRGPVFLTVKSEVKGEGSGS